MTELLERAIAKLQMLSSDRQDEVAEALLKMVEESMDVQLGREQIRAVARRLETPAGYATHEEVAASFGQVHGAQKRG
ncbi:MAG: hypothetical protein OXQ31_21440 [Spirochaetaceae bacterium]|nr:hypothetical protein [Spirochaetaceae bacterium]